MQGWPSSTPAPFTSGEKVLTAKVNGLCPGSPAACTQVNSITLTLDPKNLACNTADKFLLNGEFWFAGFGSTPTKGYCCGTE